MNPFIMHAVLKKAKKSGRINNISYDGDIVTPICILSGILVMGGFMGMLAYVASKEQAKKIKSEQVEENAPSIVLDIGEHIISEPIKKRSKDTQVYEYHPGYKPIGVSSLKYGKYSDSERMSILYVNDTPVEVTPTSKKDDEYVYAEFGIPTEYTAKEIIDNGTTFEYPEGTHIISIPVRSKYSSINQYEFHEGYEPIGIAMVSYFDNFERYGDGCVLYVNTEDVIVEKSEDENIVDFGIPKEEVKVNIKK